MADSASSTLTVTVVVGWLLTLLTFGGGIWQFTSGQRQANRRPCSGKAARIVLSGVRSAAKLRRKPTPHQMRRGSPRFWRLYWGPSQHRRESPAVEGAMVALGQHVPKEPVASRKIADERTRRACLTSWRMPCGISY